MSYSNENRSRSRSASGGRSFRGSMNTGTFKGYRSNNRSGFGGGRSNRQKTWPIYELEKVIQDLKKTQPFEQPEETSYIPKHQFNDFEISPKLKQNIVTKGYTSPTPIQDKTIPAIINGRDIIGIANTGTGKTAAFLIPLIERVSRDRSRKVLILTPTRELAVQIYEEFRSYSTDMRIYSAVLIGGANIERQKTELKKQPSFVIATPGRLKDLLKQKAIRISDYNTVVLDETDRMVDIGFISDIKLFISLMPKNRQSLFFSATVSPKVEEILQSFVQDPVTVSVKKQETAVNVEQKIVRVFGGGTKKLETLHQILLTEECAKVLVFGSTKWGVQKLADALVQKGHKAEAIHGNKSQAQRQLALKKFKTNEIKVLLATDVASRGLDIKDVSHVINYDMPESYEAYVHRIGRTGRADKKGIALTLVEY
ncbi:DEAD/DEAH box helicase [candidate division WWE3 bacterium]|uniref:DEAD/DEAH box helicase n=1 Tax=candidate division WWE3 bacterium TaxID=2053526 RepID=A0A7X9DK04_UNCKA|nr:DEAD/DEAH box helicase [candidate division WWE3 bacterium]